MGILLPLLSIFGLTSIFSHILKVRFTFSLPIVTSILVAILLLCAVCGILYYASGFIIIIGLVAQLYSLYAFPNIRKLILQYKIELFFLAFITVIYGVFLQARYLYCWDDLAFWSIFTQELTLYNEIFPQSALSSVLPSHIHYPRGPSLFHYFMLYFSGFSDSSVLLAHFILQMLFLAPIMANRYWWQTILLVSLLLLFPVITGTTLRSLYNDALVGFIFSSILMIFILEQNKNKALWLVTPLLLLMPLFREIGLVLSLCATIIISSDLTVNYRQILKTTKSKILVFISLALLPFITYHLWFAYVEAHTVIGRDSHSIQRALEIILSFFDKNSSTKLIAILFIQSLGRMLTSAQFLSTYAVLLFAWYCVGKYGKPYKNSFKTMLISSIAAFVIFLLWRFYIYIFVIDVYKTSNTPIISLDSMVRYSTSYIIVFYAIACAYIKETLLTYRLNKYSIFALLVITIGIFSFIANNVLKMPKLTIDNPEAIFKKQTQCIYDLIQQGYKIEYDYRLDSNIALARKQWRCSKLFYTLAPYYTSESRDRCISQPMPPKGYISTIEHNKINSNIKVNDILRTSQKYSCDIEYYPMYNNINILCTEN